MAGAVHIRLLRNSSTPSRSLTAVVSLEGDQARFGMNKNVSSLTFRPLKYLPTYLQKCNTRSQYVYEIARCRLNR